jgi:predicted RND superfamily exporter protein
VNLFGRFVANRPLAATLLWLLLCVPPILGACGIRWGEVRHDRWGSEDDRAELAAAEETFTYEGFPIVLVAQSPDFADVARLRAMLRLVDSLPENADVSSVFWAGTVPTVSLFGKVRPTLSPDLDDDELVAAFVGLAEHPLGREQLVSADRSLLLISLAPNWWSDDVASRIGSVARNLVADTDIRIRVSGAMALWGAYHSTVNESHLTILSTACGLVVVLALVIFRRPSAILIAVSGPVVGVAWTLGWLRFLSLTGNELSQIILPVLVLMIGFTDGVHLVVQLRQERARGADRRTAVITAISHVGIACLLTSVTTAIGFASLLLAESEMVQGFGRVCAIGVLISFVAVVLTIPLLSLSWFGRRLEVGFEKDLVVQRLDRCAGLFDFVVRHAKKVALFGVVLTGLLLAKASQLVPDDQLGHRIPNRSEAYKALRDVDRSLGGIRVMRILLKWNEAASNETLLTVLRRVEDEVDAEPLFSRPLSIRKVLAVLPGSESPAKLALASLIPDQYRAQFWFRDERSAQIIVRMQDLGMATYRPILDHLEAALTEIESEHPGVELSLTGEAIVESRVVQRIVTELFESLLLAGVIIFGVITVAFRSVRFGVLSVVPNLLPLAATGAIRAAYDPSLDIASACSFAICLGIAVDDTIHFLTRFRHEREAGRDVSSAVHQTFVTVGGALIMTTVVLVAGFGSVMLSELPTHFLFAAMACSTIATALLGDLLILPALLACFPGKSGVETGSESER